MSTDNKDWNIINDGAYGQVFEKKDGSVIITATWDGKGFKYTSHYPPPKTDTVVEDKGLKTGIMSQMDMYQMGYKDGTKYGNIGTYTQSEVDAIREETFLASRRLNGAKKCSCYDMKFPYYSDYLNSLNPDNKAYTGKDSKVDWEIIQFNQKDGSTLWVGKNIYKCWYIYDKLLRRNFDRDEKWMIENGYPIHSVKRLSDNTVFSVKERDSDGFLITGFNIIGNQIEVELDYGSRKISLTHLQPQPIPEKTVTDNTDVLFTTEDGVDIANVNDTVWKVGKTDFSIEQSNACHVKNNTTYIQQGFLVFSTEKAAKNHIKCNAKLLSFNDVWNLSDNKSTDKAYVVIKKDDLTKAVNQKLKTHTP